MKVFSTCVLGLVIPLMASAVEITPIDYPLVLRGTADFTFLTHDTLGYSGLSTPPIAPALGDYNAKMTVNQVFGNYSFALVMQTDVGSYSLRASEGPPGPEINQRMDLTRANLYLLTSPNATSATAAARIELSKAQFMPEGEWQNPYLYASSQGYSVPGNPGGRNSVGLALQPGASFEQAFPQPACGSSGCDGITGPLQVSGKVDEDKTLNLPGLDLRKIPPGGVSFSQAVLESPVVLPLQRLDLGFFSTDNHVDVLIQFEKLSTLGYEEFKVTSPIPEPSTWALMLGGLALVMGTAVRSRRRADSARSQATASSMTAMAVVPAVGA